MAEICVCGLDDMPGVVAQVRPARLISLLPADQQPPTPPQLRAADHLRVLIDDVDEPREGFTAPAREHVEELVRFLRASPPGREIEATRLLRRAGPFTIPNRLLVRLADSALSREGSLVAALGSLGEPEWNFDLEPFFLPRAL